MTWLSCPDAGAEPRGQGVRRPAPAPAGRAAATLVVGGLLSYER